LDRLTRKELKTDKFALEVTHSLEYVSEHRRQTMIYGGAALALVLVAAGTWYYRRQTHDVRQAELAKALQIREASVTVAPMPDDPRRSFPSTEEKTKALRKAFQDIVTRYSGSDEASVARFHLAVMDSDAGNIAEAEKQFKAVADEGDGEYASSAKLSLAQIYASSGKIADAERLLRELIANPTLLVSKEQATISLARVLATSKPAEARKLLEPLLKDERQAVSRNASAVLGEIPTVPAK
jgi:predicted negative regulator of RcsB-dependent stress response